MAYNIADLFEHTVDSVADREVLVVGDQRRTYAQLEARANQLAHHLIAQGIGPGDHVGVYGSNSVEWIEAALAAYKVRAVPVNVNFRYVEEELRYLFDNADFKAVVYDREFAPRIEAVRDSLPLLQHLIHIDDGVRGRRRRRPRPLGLGRLRGRHGRGIARARLRPALRRRPLRPLHRRHHRACPRASCGARRTCSSRWAAASTPTPTSGWRRSGRWPRRPRPWRRRMRSLNLPPLMHGAAQWGFLRFAFEGNFVVMLVASSTPHEVWRTVEREGINNVSITGDAMARPDDRGPRGAGRARRRSTCRRCSCWRRRRRSSPPP